MKFNKVLIFGFSILVGVGLVFVFTKASKAIFGTAVGATTYEGRETTALAACGEYRGADLLFCA